MSIFRKGFVAFLAFILISCYAFADRKKKVTQIIPITTGKAVWIDSVYNKLTIDERIGQLFMVAAYSGGKNYNEELITQLLKDHQIGGLIFMQGGPARQALLTNKYQQLAQVPLLIAMDAEWGIGMRLDSVKSFPRQMMLGATHDTALAYELGASIAAQCNRLGVNIDFAPDVDVNNNPANPVINTRSFGEDKTWVAKLGIGYMRGLQNNGVKACAKHFPGHGDTNVDSHKDLPLILKPYAALDTLELYPFKELIARGVKSVMSAHLEVPALDTQEHLPTSLSKNTISNLLKAKLNFTGLVISDALSMKGVTKYFPAGDADLVAFEAGNDILLFSQDVPKAILKIKTAIDSGAISQEMLEHSVKKILSAKYESGLNKFKNIEIKNIVEDLNQKVFPLRYKIAQSAITLVRDDNDVLNKINENLRLSYIGINANTTTPLYEGLENEYKSVDAYWYPKNSDEDAGEEILNKISVYDAVIVGIHNLNYTPDNNYGIDNNAVKFIQQLSKKKNVLIALMGNAYAMQSCFVSPSLLLGYDDDSVTNKAMADILIKKSKIKGDLPVSPVSLVGKYNPPAIKTIKYNPENSPELKPVLMPKDAGVKDPEMLDKLDMFLQRCITDGVFPGCRVFAAKNGQVFYDKSFGYLKYDKETPVDENVLYDMASCTKILATTISVMRLYEEGKLDLDKKISDYLPASIGTNKADIKIKDLLLHQAGLKAWIPFYKETLDEKGRLNKRYYRKFEKGDFQTRVARDVYLRNDYMDTIWKRIYTSKLDNAGKSVYSDLDYYFLGAIVEKISSKTIDEYADEQFYKPLGLSHILFKPLRKFGPLKIAPTENDISFRNQQIYGFVHDPGAAMFGGVAGHAGLFSTAGDAAVIFQMLLNKGLYAGKRYFKPATVELFTKYNSLLNHRGLGFDKPAVDEDNGGPAGDRCSAFAFGHQGFTGTCAWADPATGIVFVFLSNRVFPSAANNKINKLSVRTIAQDYIYESFGIPVNHERKKTYDKQVAKEK